MKFLDLFAGIGGFRLGMEQAGHKCEGFVEWDPHARKSYEAIHNTKGEWTAHDITKITDEELGELKGKGIDVICGGFPCQAFSVAGKRGGFSDTRGTLFFEIARIAKQIKPRLLLLENVKGLLSHDKGNTFGTILHTLDELGYDAEWQVLNSKDFGVPQNRERVFIVGHLRGGSGGEVFPISGQGNPFTTLGKSTKTAISRTFTAGGNSGGHHSGMTIIQINNPIHSNDRVYDEEGISPTLNTMQGGSRQPYVLIREATKKGYDEAFPGDSINYSVPTSKTRRGRVGRAIANTLDTSCMQGVLTEDFRIRRLTPRECWRLQGFPDWAFDKAREVVSDTQLYKQAGNSVTVNVIYEIAKRLEESTWKKNG